MIIGIILIIFITVLLGNIVRKLLFSSIIFPKEAVVKFLSKNHKTYVSHIRVSRNEMKNVHIEDSNNPIYNIFFYDINYYLINYYEGSDKKNKEITLKFYKPNSFLLNHRLIFSDFR